MAKPNFIVVRDTKEKTNYWEFTREDYSTCLGTYKHSLKTGDYTLLGLENDLCIERKQTTGELAQNIFEARFDRELERMAKIKHSYLVMQFDLFDVEQFPINSGIPESKWSKLKCNAELLKRRIVEYSIKYNVKPIFGGFAAKGIVTKILTVFSEHPNVITTWPEG